MRQIRTEKLQAVKFIATVMSLDKVIGKSLTKY